MFRIREGDGEDAKRGMRALVSCAGKRALILSETSTCSADVTVKGCTIWPPATLLTRTVILRSERLETRSAISPLLAEEASRTEVRNEREGNSWWREDARVESLEALRP